MATKQTTDLRRLLDQFLEWVIEVDIECDFDSTLGDREATLDRYVEWLRARGEPPDEVVELSVLTDDSENPIPWARHVVRWQHLPCLRCGKRGNYHTGSVGYEPGEDYQGLRACYCGNCPVDWLEAYTEEESE